MLGPSRRVPQRAQESLCLLIGHVNVDRSVKKTTASFLHHDGSSST